MHISSWIIPTIMLTVSPQAFGFVSCLICITVLSVVFAISSIVMHKLLQRMNQLRDNLFDMRRNPVYNNVHLGCDCRFHSHQCTCDGPQMLTFRWVGNVGSQSSNRFESKGTCGIGRILTSGSDSNEVILQFVQVSCFDHGTKLPMLVHFVFAAV